MNVPQQANATSQNQLNPQMAFGQRIENVSDLTLINALRSETLTGLFHKDHKIWSHIADATNDILHRCYEQAGEKLASAQKFAMNELNLHRFDYSTAKQWYEPVALINNAQIVLSFKALVFDQQTTNDQVLNTAQDIVKRYNRREGSLPEIYDPVDIADLRSYILEEYRGAGRELTQAVLEHIDKVMEMLEIVDRRPKLRTMDAILEGNGKALSGGLPRLESAW